MNSTNFCVALAIGFLCLEECSSQPRESKVNEIRDEIDHISEKIARERNYLDRINTLLASISQLAESVSSADQTAVNVVRQCKLDNDCSISVAGELDSIKETLGRQSEESSQVFSKVKRLKGHHNASLKALCSSALRLLAEIDFWADSYRKKVREVPSEIDLCPVEQVEINLVLLYEPRPAYPKRALQREIEGEIRIRYRVDEDGRPFAIQVVDQKPKGVFLKPTVEAISNTRYRPFVLNESRTYPIVEKIITFKID